MIILNRYPYILYGWTICQGLLVALKHNVKIRKNVDALVAMAWFFSFSHVLLANNISISNVTTSGQNAASDFTLVDFDISWSNSWRTSTGPANWDAAWVFIKYQVGVSDPVFTNVTLTNGSNTIGLPSVLNLRVGMPVFKSAGGSTLPSNAIITNINPITNEITISGNVSTTSSNNTLVFRRIWEHASLNTTTANHTAPAGSSLDLPTDGKGVFIYRSSNGTGTFSLSGVKLRWEYGADGLEDDAIIQVQVFGIEMVNVPQGSFGAGDGANGFTLTTINTSIASTLPTGSGGFSGSAEGGYPSGQTAPTANWPNGHNAFYCMKYEISQGQYRDFLNTLTYNQQVNRTATSPASTAGTGGLISTNVTRNGIDIQTPGVAASFIPAVYGCNLDADGIYNEPVDGEWIACNYLSWQDGSAYLDWACLRPLTELEFEKACRGNQAPLANEYAWGTTSITQAATISNAGANNEGISTAQANCVYYISGNAANSLGPIRVGAFAATGTTRAQAGSSYWGILELSGNLSEEMVTIGNLTGQSFDGINGDGLLSANGHGNTANWPGITNGEITAATGSGLRGGSRSIAATNARVSDRQSATAAIITREASNGFRGGRTYP